MRTDARSATGVFSDGQMYPITDDCIWTSSNQQVAQTTNLVGNHGRVLPIEEGFAQITAFAPGNTKAANANVSVLSPN